MCSVDYDEPEFYNSRLKIARQDHVCSECERPIIKKEMYQYTFAKWDDKPSTFKTCIHCYSGQQWLLEQCGGFLHGGLHEEMHDHAEEYRKMSLFRFLVGFRRNWKKFKSDGLMKVMSLETII